MAFSLRTKCVFEWCVIFIACTTTAVVSQYFTSDDIPMNIARFDNHINDIDDSSFETNTIPKYKKKEMQREFLNLLGLRQRPRPSVLRGGQNHSAPQFMLDLYNSLSTYDDDVHDTEEYDDFLYNYPRNVLSSMLNMAVFNYTSSEMDALGKADTIMSLPVIRKESLLQKHGAHRYHFGVTTVPQHDIINNAELRVYRDTPKAEFRDGLYNVFVYQVMHSVPNSDNNGLIYLDNIVVEPNDFGWIVFDVTYASNMLKTYPGAKLSLQLVVERFNGETLDPSDVGFLGLDSDEGREPFMVVFFTTDETVVEERISRVRRSNSSKKKNRKRKGSSNSIQDDSLQGDNSMKSRHECRKINLYVSFEELQWDDWIIAPLGYKAFYCEGECSFPLHTRLNATNHAIIQTLVHLYSPRVVPQVCCAPKRLSSIQVLYFDEQRNVILRKYKDMVVKSCGCH